MSHFLWSPKYSVGVEAMDNQHKKLIDILNHLDKAIEDKKNKAALGEIIKELIVYAQTHFQAEEQYLLQNNYKDLLQHKKEHELFIINVQKFCDDYKKDKLTLRFEIGVFIKNWLVKHICDSDKKYDPNYKKTIGHKY